MIKKKRSKSKASAHLRVVRDPSERSTEPKRIEVPRYDATTGKPLEDWRTALWHLDLAGMLFASAFARERKKNARRAENFNNACAIVRQVAAVVNPRFRAERWDGRHEPKPIELDRSSLNRMARECDEFKLNVTKKHAEDWFLRTFPRTAREAMQAYPDHPKADEFNRDGATNLARAVLSTIAAQGHDDALKVLHRWGVAHAGEQLRSERFAKDVEQMASMIRDLYLDDGPTITQFNEELMRRAYRLLGLKRPLEALNRRRRRRSAEPPAM